MLKYLFIVCILFPVAVTGQLEFRYDQTAETRFTDALNRYRSNDFAGAFALFDSLRNGNSVNQKTTAAWIMAGKSLYRQHQYRSSVTMLNGFLHQFPESEYEPDARFTIGLDYLMLQDYRTAASQLLRSIDSSSAPGLFRRSMDLFRSVCREHLPVDELRELHQAQTTAMKRDLVSIALAEKYYITGQSQKIGSLLDEIAYRVPPGSFTADAIEMKGRISQAGQRTVGVVLPLSKSAVIDNIRSVAAEILGGITTALKNDRLITRSERTPDIDVKDTGIDSATTVSAIRAFADNPNVLAIIGPLFSQMAMLSAPIAEKSGIPLISPTAASDGIAAIGPNIFQVTPDYSLRGRLMAEYAVRELGMTTLAVLGSGDENARAMAGGFVNEARHLGATVVTVQYFTPGATDLREQFIALRTDAFNLEGIKESPENLDVPLTGIDAIYFPISTAEDIGVIASQRQYFNIQTQMLGSNEWYDEGQLDLQKRYVNGVIFSSDWFIDTADNNMREFQRSYLAETGRQPTHYAMLGYDVMHLVIEQIKKGAVTREKLRTALAAVRNYRGLQSGITFAGGRVNSVLQFLKYDDGEITHLRGVMPGH